MTTLCNRIEDALSNANTADVRALNEAIRKTERLLADMRRTRDAIIAGNTPTLPGFAPADSLDQESSGPADPGADLHPGHFDADFYGYRS